MNLSVEEASLTGESVPAKKTAEARLEKDIPLGDRENSAFMGTTVTYGRGKGVVTSTGMHTQLGLIATMLQAVEDEETPLQKRLDQLGKTLGVAAIIICILVFLVSAARLIFMHEVELGGEEFWREIIKLFMVAVSLAIAAVPEGLPAVVTISLAGGMREMVNRHALIRRLSSVETLGSVTTICTDKTGTLTQNEMTVTKLWVDGKFVDITGIGYDPVGEFYVDGEQIDLAKTLPAANTALWVGTLNNDASLEHVGEVDGKPSFRMIGDPTEGSILVAAVKAGAVTTELNEKYPREQEIPFDSTRKRMVTVHEIVNPGGGDISPYYADEKTNWYTIAVKGAPDVVLGLCTYISDYDNKPIPLTDEMRKKVLAANEAMADDALRVLGVAYRPVAEVPEKAEAEQLEHELIFVGLIGMIDPSRPEVKPALAAAQTAGVRSVMITGDFPNTARAIAADIGLLQPGHQVLTGMELDKISDEEMIETVKITDVYARVSPEHKMRIVEALRKNGEVVAMTGDGVNDAPALKAAHIGIAMGARGTDVAREAASLVLLDDDFSSIVQAVRIGRRIHDNIKKAIAYIFAIHVPIAGMSLLPALCRLPLALLPVHIVFLELIIDPACSVVFEAEPEESGIMERPPRSPKEKLFNRRTLALGIAQGVAVLIIVLAVFLIAHHIQKDANETRALTFTTLIIANLGLIMTNRSWTRNIWDMLRTTNNALWWVIGGAAAFLALVLYTPFLRSLFRFSYLHPTDIAICICAGAVSALWFETMKFFRSRSRHLAANRQ